MSPYMDALITKLLGECTGGKASTPGSPSGLFPDHFIHLGGDEVNTGCWSQNADIAKWLSDRGMSPDDGYAYFVKRAAQIALDQGRRPVQWVEVFDHFYKATDLQKVDFRHVSVPNRCLAVRLYRKRVFEAQKMMQEDRAGCY